MHAWSGAASEEGDARGRRGSWRQAAGAAELLASVHAASVTVQHNTATHRKQAPLSVWGAAVRAVVLRSSAELVAAFLVPGERVPRNPKRCHHVPATRTGPPGGISAAYGLWLRPARPPWRLRSARRRWGAPVWRRSGPSALPWRWGRRRQQGEAKLVRRRSLRRQGQAGPAARGDTVRPSSWLGGLLACLARPATQLTIAAARGPNVLLPPVPAAGCAHATPRSGCTWASWRAWR